MIDDDFDKVMIALSKPKRLELRPELERISHALGIKRPVPPADFRGKHWAKIRGFTHNVRVVIRGQGDYTAHLDDVVIEYKVSKQVVWKALKGPRARYDFTRDDNVITILPVPIV